MPKGNQQDKGKRTVAKAPRAPAADTGANLDKIRDILFGQQMRDSDKRFAAMEDRLRKETANLREEMARRLDSLETYMKKEMGALHDRLKGEQRDRTDADKDLAKDLQVASKAIDKRLEQLDDQFTKGDRGLREQLLDQTKSLESEIRAKYADAGAALDRAVGELRHEKADRTALSGLLADMAMRLSGEYDEAADGA